MQAPKRLCSVILSRINFGNNNIFVRYIRGERNFPRPRRPFASNNEFFDDLDMVDDDDTVMNELERLEDAMINADLSRPRFNKLKSVEKEHKEFVKRKIIEKKYFRKPPQVNLLTWEAKEQIKYLNAQFPNEWTVDRLAKSFPTDREGIIRILKGSYIPKNDQEILKHDKRVRKRWASLKAGEEGGPMDPTLERLIESKKINLMLHAGGNQSLPKPNKLRTISSLLPEPPRKGIFSNIIDSYEKQVKEKENSRNVYENSLTPPGSAVSSQNLNLQNSDVALLESIVKNVTESQNANEKQILTEKSVQLIADLDMSSQPDIKEKESRNRVSRRERKLMKKQTQGMLNIDLTNVKTLTMLDTRKISDSYSELEENTENSEEIEQKQLENSQFESKEKQSGNIQKFKSSGESNVHKLQYEETNFSKSHGKMERQAYIYDQTKGYQYPFGYEDRTLESVEIPKKQKRRGQTYQKGKVVYDEDGDFLFRIP